MSYTGPADRRIRSAVVLVCVLCFLFQSSALRAMAEPPSPVNLDLTSTARDLTPGNMANAAALTINVGGTSRQINPTSSLTPAERLAAYQVFSTGQQSIMLSLQGNAVGGSFSMGEKFNQYVSSLVIPQGVTAVKDFTSSAVLSLIGNLTNSGNLYAVSNVHNSTATIAASNIYNQQGGLISTVLPANGLPGFANAASKVNLSLVAANNVVNAGTISSSGQLSVTAGGAITNALPSGGGGPSPVMQALSDVNLTANSITNAGIVSSTSGNLNVQAMPASNLAVKNANGSLQALTGQINLGDPLNTLKTNISVTGGDLLSRELNVYSGDGKVNLNVSQISGQMNISAGEAHTSSSSGMLRLGSLKLSGDPTFFNDGDIEITGNITSNEALSLVASGNITSNGDYSITVNNGTRGFEINLVAGANITAAGTTPSPQVSNSAGFVSDANVVINGPSTTGGDIDFSSNIMTINSAALNGSNPGGTVRLIAFADALGTSGGHVLLTPTSQIITSGSGTGVNGDVQIIAGGDNTAVSTGIITTSGGSGGGGQVVINVAQPGFALGSSLTLAMDGSISNSNSFVPGALGTGAVTIGGATTAANIAVSSGQNAAVNILDNIIGTESVNLAARGSGEITSVYKNLTNIGVENSPVGVAVNQAGTFAYIVNQGSDTVSKIDLSNNSVTNFSVGLVPTGVAVLPDNSVIYVTNTSSNNVSAVNTVNGQQIFINVGAQPTGAAVDPNGTFVYVTNYGNNNVSVIDSVSNTVVGTIGTGSGPTGIAVNPTGTLAYVTNATGDSVTVIDTVTRTPIATVPVGAHPVGVSFNPTGRFAYVANLNDNTVTVIDASNHSVVTNVPVGGTPHGISVNPSGTMAYVTNAGDNNVSVIDTSTNTVVSSIAVGATPYTFGSFATFVGDNVRLYVANTGSNSVSVVNLPAVIAPTVTLASTSGNINVATNAGSLTANTTGSATITESNSINIGSSTLGNAFFVGANGTVTTTAAISAPNINLQNTLLNGSISIGANVTATTNLILNTVGLTSRVLQTGGLISVSNGDFVLNTPQFGEFGRNINLQLSRDTTFNALVTGDSIDIQTIANNADLTFLRNVSGISVNLLTHGSGSITTLSTLTNRFTVGGVPTGAAVSPGGSQVYITNKADGTVSVFDTSTNQVVNTITVGAGPDNVAFSPDGSQAYVANTDGNTVSVINTSTGLVVNTISGFTGPKFIVFSPTGSKAYVSNLLLNTNTVSVVDVGTGQITGTITGVTDPRGLAITPDGKFLYVVNSSPGGPDTVSVVQTSDDTVITAVPVGVRPIFAAANPNGQFVYVTNNDTRDISVISTATNTVVQTITPPNGNPETLSLNPQGTLLYVTFGDRVSIYRTDSNTLVQNVALDGARASGNFVGVVNSNVVAFVPNNTSAPNGAVQVVTLASIIGTDIALSSTSGGMHVATDAGSGNLTVNTTGGAIISEVNNANLGASTGGNQLVFATPGSLTVAGMLDATSVTLDALGTNGGIAVNAAQQFTTNLKSFTLLASGNISSNANGNFQLPSGTFSAVSTLGGTIGLQKIDVSGDAPGVGGIGGDIFLSSQNGIQTLSLRAYGGGGSAGNCCGANGGHGGNGGYITVSSLVGPITINGDVNVSGGGGGASGFGGTGGDGGDSGDINITTIGAVTITGPVLAAGGGGGGGGSTDSLGGGGGFGGGGGGGDSGAGGGGFFGGGGSEVFSSGGGGGILGGGSKGGTDPGAKNGGPGQGGDGIGGTGTHSGGKFGSGGNELGGNIAQNGQGGAGGIGGTNGNINLLGSSIDLQGTVGTALGALGPAFSTSAFKDQTLFGHDVHLRGSTVFLPSNGIVTSSSILLDSASASGLSLSGATARIEAGTITLETQATNASITVGTNLRAGSDLTFTTGSGGKVLQTAGLIELLDSADLNLNTPQLGDSNSVIAIDSRSSLTFNVPVVGNTVNIRTTDHGANLTFNKDVTGVTSINLIADGSGSITTPSVVATTIPVGTAPEGVALNPAATLAYIVNADSDDLSVIDTATNTVIATINVGDLPQGVAFTPNGNFAYVANYNSSNVTVINASTHTVVGSPINVGTQPIGVAATPDGAFIYVTNSGADTISVIRTSDNTVVGSPIQVGDGPFGIAINPAGTFAYVTNGGGSSGTVSVIRLSDNTVVGSPIPIGGFSRGIAVSPSGRFVYAANPGNVPGNVSVIDTSTNAVVATINVGLGPEGVSFDPTGAYVYVSNVTDDTVSVISTATNQVIQTVPVGDASRSFGNFVKFVGNNVTAYVTNSGAGNVSVVRMPNLITPTLSLASTSGDVRVGTDAETLAVSTGGNVTAVQRSEISLATSSIGGTFVLGTNGAIRTVGLVTANLTNLQTSANIGTPNSPVSLSSATLNVIAGTNANLMNNVATALSSSQAGANFTLTNTGKITASDVVANILTLDATSGGIELTGDVGKVGGSTLLMARGNGEIQQSAGSVIGQNVTLKSGTGSIGSIPAPLATRAAFLSANTAGSGDVSIENTGALTLLSSGSGGDFVIHNNASMVFDNISTLNGSLSVVNDLGSLTLNPGARLTANGSVQVQNRDTTSGTIVLSTNSFVGSGGGNVSIFIGTTNPNQNLGTKPVQVTESKLNGGQIFYNNGITAVAPTNFVTANGAGKKVIFDTGSLPGSAIKLNGGVRIQAVTNLFVTSLDLTDLANVTIIKQQQDAKILGGSLTINGGIASGGTLIINPTNLSARLSGINIPAGVTTTLNSFPVTSIVNVGLTSASHTPSAIVSGTLQFSGAGTSGVLIVDSELEDPTIVVNSTGTANKGLTSSASLLVSAVGDVSLLGPVAATTLQIFATGTITNLNGGTARLVGTTVQLGSGTGSIGSLTNPIRTTAANLGFTSQGSVFITNNGATALNPSTAGDLTLSSTGALNIKGAVTATNSISLTALGSSAISQTASGLLTAPVVTLASTSGLIGTLAQFIKSSGASLSANTTGAVYLSPSGEVNLGASSGGIFQVTASGASSLIGIGGVLSATNITIKNNTGGNINVAANIKGLGAAPNATSVTLLTTGSGRMSSPSVLNPAVISTNELILTAASGNIGTGALGAGPIRTNTTKLTFNTTGNVNIEGTGAPTGVNNSTGKDVTISADNINMIGTLKATGNISLTTGNGKITQSAAGVKILGAQNIDLQGAQGIGTSTVPVGVSGTTASITPTLHLASSSGNVYVAATGSALLDTDSSSGGTSTSEFKLSSTASITLIASITSPGLVSLTAGTTGGIIALSGALNGQRVALSAGSGGIGTSGLSQSVNVALANGATAPLALTLNTTGRSAAFSEDAIQLGASSSTKGLVLSTLDAVTTGGNSSATSGALELFGSTITTSHTLSGKTVLLEAGSTVTVNAAVTGTNGVSIVAPTSFTSGPNGSLTSTNSPISVASDAFTVNGLIKAGTGVVSLIPNTLTKTVGVATPSGLVQIPASVLTKVTAGTLIIGTSGTSALMSVGALSAPNLNLSFINGAGISFNGNATVGSTKTFTVQSGPQGITIGGFTVGGGTFTQLNAGTGGIGTTVATAINGTTVNLVTGNAGIESINTNAATLLLNSTGTAVITETGGMVSLGNITNSISASDLTIGFASTVTNGSITIPNNITVTNDLTLNAKGTGSITQAKDKFLEATTGGISFSSDSGAIGTTTQSMSIKTGNLQVHTTGNVFIKDSLPVALASSTGNTFQLIDDAVGTTTPSIAVTGSLSANNVTLSATNTTNGKIDLSANIQGLSSANATKVFLQVTGSGTFAVDSAEVFTNDLKIQAGTGDVNLTANPLTFSAQSQAGVTLTANRPLTISAATTVGTFEIFGNAGATSVTFSNPVTSIDPLDGFIGVSLQDGQIVLGALLKSAGQVSLFAGNGSSNTNITQTAAGTKISAPVVFLHSSQKVGTSTVPIGIANHLGNSLDLSMSGGSNDVFLTSGSSVNFPESPSATVQVKSLKLTLTDGSLAKGSITFASQSFLDVQNSISLTTGAAGSITQVDGSALLSMQAPTILLNAGTGGIGSASNNIALRGESSGGITTLTVVSKGNVFINDPDAGSDVILKGANSAAGTLGFNLKALGSISFNAATTPVATTISSTRLVKLEAGTSLTTRGITVSAVTNSPATTKLIAHSGALTVAGNITINGGSLDIQNTDTSSGTIAFNDGVVVQTVVSTPPPTENGLVQIFIGSSATETGQGPPFPANVTVNETGGGKVFFGTHLAAIQGPSTGTATVTGKGQNVLFDSPSNTRTITLGNGTKITADPPVPNTPQLFAPDKDTTVPTAFGDLSIAAGSVVLVVSKQDGLAVYDLHDSRTKPVSFTSGSNTMSLAPGRHLLMTSNDVTAYEQVNPLEKVSHRKLEQTQFGANKAFTSEFSIVSAVYGLKQLKHLAHSSNPQERRVFNRLMKNAAIMQTMRGAMGGYQRLGTKQSYATANDF